MHALPLELWLTEAFELYLIPRSEQVEVGLCCRNAYRGCVVYTVGAGCREHGTF